MIGRTKVLLLWWNLGGACSEALTHPRAKIIAFGNSTFIQNQYGNMADNFTFFLKATNYLASDDELLTLNLAIKKNSPILIDDKQLKIVFYVSVIVLPLILFTVAFLFYRRRRA